MCVLLPTVHQSAFPQCCFLRHVRRPQVLGWSLILLVVVDAIVHRMDKKESVCVAFLDLRKAFDSLDHCMLLHQLSNLGISNAVLRWFQDYLSDRTHRVKCHHQYSPWALMKGGIPQGSALGPLLFLIYMNTLPSVISDALLLLGTSLLCQHNFEHNR